MSSIVVAVVQVVSTVAGSVLMDRAGRKMLLLVSSAVMCVSLGEKTFSVVYVKHRVRNIILMRNGSLQLLSHNNYQNKISFFHILFFRIVNPTIHFFLIIVFGIAESDH